MSDIEKSINHIWSEFQRNTGVPISRRTRRCIEDNLFGNELESVDGDPDREQELLELLEARLEELRLVLSDVRSVAPTSARAVELNRPNVKLKSLDRHLHLYLYASQRLEMTQGRVNRGSWNRVSEEWNRDHPYDQMSSATLTREWNRAKLDTAVLGNVLILRQVFENCHAVIPDAWKAIHEAQVRTPSVPSQWMARFLWEMKLEGKDGGQDSEP